MNLLPVASVASWERRAHSPLPFPKQAVFVLSHQGGEYHCLNLDFLFTAAAVLSPSPSGKQGHYNHP